MEWSAKFLLIPFLFSCAFIFYIVYDAVSLLFGSDSIFYSSIFVVVLILIAALLTTFKKRKPFWLETSNFFGTSCVIIFSVALSFLVYFIAAWTIVAVDQFQPTYVLVFSVIFPVILTLIFSLYYFAHKIFSRNFIFYRSLIKSGIISGIVSFALFLVIVLVGSYLLYFGSVSSFQTASSENNRLTEFSQLETSAQKEFVYSENLSISLDPVTTNLQVYKDLDDFQNKLSQNIQNIHTASSPYASKESFLDSDIFVECLTDKCYQKISDQVTSVITTATNSYQLFVIKHTIINESQTIESGYKLKTSLDQKLELRAAEGENVILFNSATDTLESYLEKIKPLVDTSFETSSPDQIKEVTKPSDILKVSGLSSNLPIGDNSLISVHPDVEPLMNSVSFRLLLTSKQSKTIGDLSVSSYNLYSKFTQRFEVLEILFENRNIDEPIESKYIRYKILYAYTLGK